MNSEIWKRICCTKVLASHRMLMGHMLTIRFRSSRAQDRKGSALEQLPTELVDNGYPPLGRDRYVATIQARSDVSDRNNSAHIIRFFFSYQRQNTATDQAVNLLWLASLVFSIASAINSQLAFYLDLANHRTPESRLGIWALFYITQGPVVYIVVAVMAFSAGLVCFAFVAFPDRASIPIVVTALTSITWCLLLTAVLCLAEAPHRLFGTLAQNVSHSNSDVEPPTHILSNL